MKCCNKFTASKRVALRHTTCTEGLVRTTALDRVLSTCEAHKVDVFDGRLLLPKIGCEVIDRRRCDCGQRGRQDTRHLDDIIIVPRSHVGRSDDVCSWS